MKAPEPQNYTSRQTSQEIAAVEICPEYPEYMVIGTYSLVKDDDDKGCPAQVRKGCLLVMPVSSTFKPTHPGHQPPVLDVREFSCAILDLHFHPSDTTLLGVATSNAQIHFYRFVKQADIIARHTHLELVPLGSATIAPNDIHGLVPLITQFTWLEGTLVSGKQGKHDRQSVALIATTSLYEVLLVRAIIPAITSNFDGLLETEVQPVTVATKHFPSHSLEAWTVAATVVETSGDHLTYLVLSGGDDSALIASLTELGPIGSPTDDSEPSHAIFTDIKTHTAGVVAILPLKPIKVTDRPNHQPRRFKYVSPILTGSYDEGLRLFIYDPAIARKRFVTEAQLHGGVWRLKLMDEYIEKDSNRIEDGENAAAEQSRENVKRHHFLILASCMHAGVKIVRLTLTPEYHDIPQDAPGREELAENMGWQIEAVAQFSKGHESMVYCCDFLKVEDEAGPGAYTVVSTSFYDKQVCVWGFVDEIKRTLAAKEKS